MKKLSIGLLCGLLFVLSSCDSEDNQDSVPAAIVTNRSETAIPSKQRGTILSEPDPSNPIPRLSPGPHLGMIAGFEPLGTTPFDREARVQQLVLEANRAGQSISRYMIDWAELETAPGIFDQARLDELLALVKSDGNASFVTLSTLDSGGLTLPAYLSNNDGRLRSGLSLDSPQVINAFDALLDWLIPQLSKEDVWGISLGNEVDDPVREGFVKASAARHFFQTGLQHVKRLDPQMAATVTLTINAAATLPDMTAAIIKNSDIATFNYYCLDADLKVTQMDQWRADIAKIKTDARGKQIYLQELGCPVGYGDDGKGAPKRPSSQIMGSPQTQVEFFEFFAEIFVKDEQLRAATLFQLLDWSPQLASSFAMPLREEGIENFANRFEEWLATSGACRWSDGTCRIGWQSWLTALKRTAEARRSR